MATNSGMSVNHGKLKKHKYTCVNGVILRYNGMRPNGFPENHYHGGKGTESVCHFCCNPTSSDGMFCNRKLLDGTDEFNRYAQTSEGDTQYGLEFSDGTGFWFEVDSNHNDDDAGNAFIIITIL